eukprot:NODE_510_length_7452_cov_0.223990.p3 type:complete len:169 gc:universal NODE_510_length_7452_cov_0.223990:3277-3783(+)
MCFDPLVGWTKMYLKICLPQFCFMSSSEILKSPIEFKEIISDRNKMTPDNTPSPTIEFKNCLVAGVAVRIRLVHIKSSHAHPFSCHATHEVAYNLVSIGSLELLRKRLEISLEGLADPRRDVQDHMILAGNQILFGCFIQQLVDILIVKYLHVTRSQALILLIGSPNT